MSDPAAVASPANTAPIAAQPQQQAQAAPKVAAPVEAEPIFWEGKIDGKPVKLTKAQADRYLSKAGFADSVISKTRDYEKSLQKQLAEAKEREAIWDDEEKLMAELEKRGKLDKLARKRLEAKVAEQEMTPEQKEAAAARAEAEALKKQLAEREEKEKAARVSARAKQLAQHMENTLVESVERAGLKSSPDMLVALNDVMSEWAQIGLLSPNEPFAPATADAIVDAANAKIQESKRDLTQRVAKGLKGQALEDFLGAEIANELIRHRIELKRNGGKPAQVVPITQQQRKPADGPGYKSPLQLREEREARMRR